MKQEFTFERDENLFDNMAAALNSLDFDYDVVDVTVKEAFVKSTTEEEIDETEHDDTIDGTPISEIEDMSPSEVRNLSVTQIEALWDNGVRIPSAGNVSSTVDGEWREPHEHEQIINRNSRNHEALQAFERVDKPMTMRELSAETTIPVDEENGGPASQVCGILRRHYGALEKTGARDGMYEYGMTDHGHRLLHILRSR